jgi:subtilisin family serine protease
MKHSELVSVLALGLSLLGAAGAGAPPQTSASIPPYSYYHHGKLVVLTKPSLVAVSGRQFSAFVSAQRLTRDPRSAHAALRARGLGLYALPVSRQKEGPPLDLLKQAREFTTRTREEVQPVFELGQALLIPSDELIVRLAGVAEAREAEEYLARQKEPLGIVEVRPVREGTFLVRIKDAAHGGVYDACRRLAKLEGVEFAEPNHTVVLLEPPGTPDAVREYVDGLVKARQRSPARAAGAGQVGNPTPSTHSVSWDVLVDESFEGTALPAGWSTGILPPPPSGGTRPDVAWSVTRQRSHDGRSSAYATGAGTAGRPAPGPYPNDAGTFLATPLLDLASYEEVYVEIWFWANFGANSSVGYDLGAAWVRDTAANQVYLVLPFAALYVGYTGDLTADPTTDRGWRRGLFRVPPIARRSAVTVEIAFGADSAGTAEGLYVDGVRIIGTKDVDTDPTGSDRFGARQYEIANSGQIAGLGSHANDLGAAEAWQTVSPSAQVTVAVVDSGVESHPDLNLVTGYDPDGSVGGGPRGSHGTSVAGNVGAVRDNSIGVAGTAPGVKVMPVYMGGTYVEIGKALRLAVAKGAALVTNSWGWVGAPSAEIESAVREALAAGVTVLFAAGNGPDRAPFTYETAFPCNLTASSDVVCVGAASPTDEYKGASSSDGQFSWGSSYVGSGPDVVAPGGWSYSTDRLGTAGTTTARGSALDAATADYTPDFGGTSSATPKVAGIVALMLSANPELSPAQVKAILRATAKDIDAPGFDDKTGAGRVDAVRAVHESLATPGQPRAYHVQAVGSARLAKAGNKEPASIVVATNGPEGPVTGLALGDFRAKAGPVAPGGCEVEITRVVSGFAGRYLLDVIPYSSNPACIWRAGRYTVAVLVSHGRRSGVGVTDLEIP